jgi:matrix metalloproteinase-14 (membrane-inserted)
MVTVRNKVTYVFQGNKYWKLTDTSVEPGYPRPISEGWNGLPGDLDAAFAWTNGKTYFFKGFQYWRFSEVGVMDDGYPKNFGKRFAGVPDNVDAAMVWPINKKIYFFKGSKYWKFDPDKNPPVDNSYPRPIKNWKGIPENLDSAIQYSNGKTYFFKKGKYYRFDDRKGAVDDSADPKYPRETGLWWFGCKKDSAPLTKQ